MRRWWLYVVAGLFCCSAPAFAQMGLVVQIPANANIENIAIHANGVVVDSLPEAGLYLLSVADPPKNFPDNDVRWMELNQGARLSSSPHHVYINAPASASPDWFKTQPAFTLINQQQALMYST